MCAQMFCWLLLKCLMKLNSCHVMRDNNGGDRKNRGYEGHSPECRRSVVDPCGLHSLREAASQAAQKLYGPLLPGVLSFCALG